MKVIHNIFLNWICMLCFCGGFLNALGIIKYSHSISHFTGQISRIAIQSASFEFGEMKSLFFIIISFVLGAIVSGFLIDGREFNLKKRYGLTMLSLGSGIIFLYSVSFKSIWFFYYLPFVLGVQNGLFISYKGVVVRSTHISGSITDVGVYIGHCLKGKKEDGWKVLFCLMIVVIFFIGALCGTRTFLYFKDGAFLIIGIIYIIVAFLYFSLRYRYRHVLHKTDSDYHFQ